MNLSAQYALELVTAPTALPVSVTEAKAQMRVDASDDDALIGRLVDVAVSYVDVQGALGAAMITQTWAQWLGQNPGTVTLLLGPVQAVTAVKYYDVDNALQTDTLSNYNVLGTSTRTIVAPKPGFNWPTTYQRDDAIKIEYRIGYGDASTDVPENIRHAMLMLIAFHYENRETELIGTISKTLPFGFEQMLGQSRNHWYG
tara:strand:- start:154 stop:753 length:600 start_codon:yes stop_codon:yes gene_type:complete